MEQIILIGGGGHCKSVIDSIKTEGRYEIIGIADSQDKIGQTVEGVKVIAEDNHLEDIFASGVKCAFITVGSIGDIVLRKKLYDMIKAIGFNTPSIIDRSSIIAESAQIMEGAYIGKRTVINSNAKIGRMAIINTGAILEHDCTIEDFCHIAPGTVLSGHVSIGLGTHVGTNSTIIQGIKIGCNSIIGAGSVVISDIGNYKKAYGNPCREVKDER